MSENNKKLSTEPYKGVRDFYPEDMAIQNYIFDVWRKTAESFGYVEYSASPLEPTELYKAKSGEEIINEQTYSFKDRGDREVTLRPEMTPTVARMIAGQRREMKFPQRWFSIPNLFRYERPQRGRLREHYQLNCDIFGVSGIEAEAEIIALMYNVLVNFAKPKYRENAKQFVNDNFEIRINSKIILNSIYSYFNLTEDEGYKVTKLLDRKNKISDQEFNQKFDEILGEKKSLEIRTYLTAKTREEKYTTPIVKSEEEKFHKIVTLLEQLGINGLNLNYEQTMVRGFDYYTGFIIEIYDKNPENPRALFGGGRYDNLLSIFGVDPVPTVGFGMGDVTIRDVLETYGLLPEYKSKTDIALLPFSADQFEHADLLATKLREKYNVVVDYSEKKIGDKIAKADKEKISFVIVIGEDEVTSGNYKLKNLKTKEETLLSIEQILKLK